MDRLICLALGYVIGLFQTAYIFGKVVMHQDVRDSGSGNAGTTNAFRVMGKKAGVIVFLGDCLKVILAYMIASLIFGGKGTFINGEHYYIGIYAALGCILGHVFPIYMGFRGGKGIACSLGLMLCISFPLAAVTYAIGFIIFKIKHYVSLSSLCMVTVYPLLMLASLRFEAESIILMLAIAVLAFIKHKENIERLIDGTENKFSVRKES